MSDAVLVVGAGPTGLSAAAGVASVGRKVILVEKENVLGGAPIISGYAKLVPSGEWAKDAMGRMIKRVEDSKLVTIHKGTKVTKVDGQHGDFAVTLSNGQTTNVGAIILGTGFTHFDSINKPEWGFGTFEDVVTTTQMEQMVTAGKIACPSDGRTPERVAILLCVGSRDRQPDHEGRLDGAGAVHEDDAPLAVRLRVERGHRRPLRHRGEGLAYGLLDTRGVEAAHDEQLRARRAGILLVEGPCLGGRVALELLGRREHPAVGGVAIEGLAERFLRDRLRLALLQRELPREVGLEARELGVREGGVEGKVRHQTHHVGGELAEHLAADQRPVLAHVDVERAAHARGLGREGRRVLRLRGLPHQLAGKVGQPDLVLRLEGVAGADREPHHDLGDRPVGHERDAQAVAEREALRLRERERLRWTGGRWGLLGRDLGQGRQRDGESENA